MAIGRSTQQPDPGEEHIDGCVCDVEIPDGSIMSDLELPVASGGVEAPTQPADDATENDDGAGELFDFEVTDDEELPASAGGVA